jgi:hypothetical protein
MRHYARARTPPQPAILGRRQRDRASKSARRDRFGGTEGNERLTIGAAIVLTGLLVAEGITVVHMRGLVSAHMLIGLVLIPPALVKLGSTGYRFVRYYGGSPAYRAKGPPRLLLRLLAPMLVASTIGVLASGVLLLAAGQKAGALLEIHKVFFIVWIAVFGVHFLAYVPHVVRSLAAARRAGRSLPGASLRAMLVAGAVGGGVALAISLLPAITSWRR